MVDASQVGGGQLKILFALYSKYSQIHLNFTTESIIDRRIFTPSKKQLLQSSVIDSRRRQGENHQEANINFNFNPPPLLSSPSIHPIHLILRILPILHRKTNDPKRDRSSCLDSNQRLGSTINWIQPCSVQFNRLEGNRPSTPKGFEIIPHLLRIPSYLPIFPTRSNTHPSLIPPIDFQTLSVLHLPFIIQPITSTSIHYHPVHPHLTNLLPRSIPPLS